MLNKTMIIGNIAKDPETRNTAAGKAIVSFSVGVSETRNGQRETEWFRCKAFGATADFCSKYLQKGSLVFVEGKLKTSDWTDQNGQKRYQTELLCDRVQSLEKRENGRQQAAQRDYPAPAFPTASEMGELPF